jgi:hypothetical protein
MLVANALCWFCHDAAHIPFISGFALEGFHAMGPNAEDFDLSRPADLISEIIVSFPFLTWQF